MFNTVLSDIESVFGGATWQANSIPTFPANYQGSKNGINEYATISVLPSSSQHYAFGARKQVSGLLAVKLFVPAGEGQSRLMAISDLLDLVLDSKVLTNGTKLGTSYLNVEGLDSSNQSLYSGSYFIPFLLYGE
jgi:hypothetical protein